MDAQKWQYHQDGRDKAISLGFWASLIYVVLIGLFFCVVVCGCTTQCTSSEVEEQPKKMDGSTAGGNAVTVEQLEGIVFRDNWEEGVYSVTLQDLERKAEEGKAYPANGKNTPLKSDTTYGKGAGMVDMITYDKATNIQIRHYGQVQEDGTIRWYAAETVLGEDGKPVAVPRG